MSEKALGLPKIPAGTVGDMLSPIIPLQSLLAVLALEFYRVEGLEKCMETFT